jgi:hypothetical protein
MELPRRIYNDCVGDISSLHANFMSSPSTRSLNAYKCSGAAQKPTKSHNSVDGGFSELPFPAHSPPPLALRIQRRVHIKRTLRPGRGMRYRPHRLADPTFSLLSAWPVAFEVPPPLPLHDRRLLCVGAGMGARRWFNAHYAAGGAGGACGVGREFGG